MPSMRELLKDIRCGGSDYVGPFTYGLFEKLVEALEPTHTPSDAPFLCRDCQFYNETTVQCVVHTCQPRPKLSMTDISNLRAEFAEAQAEIERLRKNRDDVHRALVATEEELASYTDSVNADAEIGRLVRGMADGTGLRRLSVSYHSWRSTNRGWKWACDSTNATRALRAIQEVGDDQG